ncbi:Uncharacterised protein [Mycobacteroides abscessus subsp. massiliense]|nr:Uncharacterised protein [Mycobacteroides abscessus subsp. massiliense]
MAPIAAASTAIPVGRLCLGQRPHKTSCAVNIPSRNSSSRTGGKAWTNQIALEDTGSQG